MICTRCGGRYRRGGYHAHAQEDAHRSSLGRKPVALTGRNREIIKMGLDRSITMQQIADRFGLSRQRVQQILSGYLPGRREFSRKKKRMRTCAKCGVAYEFGTFSVHKMTAEHLASWKRTALLERNTRMVELYQQGHTCSEIVRILAEEGWSTYQPAVYRYLRRYGLEPNRGGGQYARFENGLSAMEQPYIVRAAELIASGMRPMEVIEHVPELKNKDGEPRYAAFSRIRDVYGLRNRENPRISPNFPENAPKPLTDV